MTAVRSSLGDQQVPSIREQQQYWDARWQRAVAPNAWQLERGRQVMTFVRSVAPDSPRILDLGCGTGWFTAELARLGDATGVDLSQAAIDEARARFPGVRYVAGDFYALSLPVEHYDIVVCQEVIAHAQDQAGLLKLIADVLKPDGYLVLTTVNKFVIERTEQAPDPPEHIKSWLDAAMLKRLLISRFDVVRTTTAIPMGDKGLLRLVNSGKLNKFLKLFVTPEQIDRWKGKAGWGYTRILLARRKP